MMKSRGKLLVPALLLSMCAGCFRIESLIRLSQDGSGSIFLRCLVSESLDSKALDRDVSKVASELGDGVTYVGTTKHNEKGWKGVRHEFAFKDINKLKLGKLFASMDNQQEKVEAKPDSEETALFKLDEGGKWKFEYERGETNDGIRELIVYQEPTSKEKPSDPFAQAGVDLPKAPTADIGKALAMSMVRPMLTGASASLLVQVDGEIISTNAVGSTNANSAYLFHLNFSEFAKSKEFEKAMMESWSLQRMIKDKVPGIKGMTSGEKVSIKFKTKPGE